MSGESIAVNRIGQILLVTVPPDPGDETVTALQEKVLNSMEKYQSRGVILDISVVQTLDSFFARTISETSKMVGLMGGKTIIAGMQANVAITATQLGLTLDNIETAMDVDAALSAVVAGNGS
jgi:rsbT antagonist protein RsbS